MVIWSKQQVNLDNSSFKNQTIMSENGIGIIKTLKQSFSFFLLPVNICLIWDRYLYGMPRNKKYPVVIWACSIIHVV